MKSIVCLLAALSLTGCMATPEQQQASMTAVQSQLPDGCKLSYAGDVQVAGSDTGSRVFVVKCVDVITVSATREVKRGKARYSETDVAVNL